MRVQSSLTITQGVGDTGSMRVQSSLTITQVVGGGFYEGAELSYHYTGSRTQVL